MPTATEPQSTTGNARQIVPFAAAIFLSAFLLFLLQPLVGKYILPWFGGSPATWTTCMLFFQSLLLLGYAYAHLSTRHLAPRAQAVVHVLLLGVALCLLPITPAASWKPLPTDNPTVRILLLLACTVGLPYTLLSSTAPLLQSWLTRISPASGRTGGVYRLYALSNTASFLALLTYPFLIEPLLPRRAQSLAWSAGLVLFAGLCATCAYLSARSRLVVAPSSPASEPPPAARQPALGVLLWLLLPACASLLLLAVTNKICQDIAVVPLLWILPLAIYLLSFVITFDSPRWYDRRVWVPAYFASLALVCYAAFPGNEDLPIPTRVAAYAGALFTACVLCHGELFRLRPPPARLTAYYLALSAGGALGGLFVACLAPLIFTTYAELPVGLLGSFALLCTTLYLDPATPFHRARKALPWLPILLAGTFLALTLWASATTHLAGATPVARSRNFYGTLTLYARGTGPESTLLLHHAGISHGLQLTATPALRRTPTTYYTPGSGVGLALRSLSAESRHIGIIGLGAGTLATYATPADRIRFYEINPAVTALAEEAFTYLKDSPSRDVVTIPGDGRLSLEHEPPQGFALLVLDAFSGDAIPVHLLTVEAFDTYLRHVARDGVIAVHISNQHLDLAPVVARLAAHLGLSAAYVHHDPASGNSYDYESKWVLLSRDEAVLRSPLIRDAATPLPAREDVPLWTDDYSNLLQILR